MVTARPFPHSTRKWSSWQEGGAAALLLVVLTLVYFWPQAGQGRALYWGDIGLYFTPMSAFLHDNLRQGRVPLWNPLILCGTPYVGNPQTWPLYPLTALLPFLPAPYFLSLTVALHVWLAGLGTYFFLRRAMAVGWGAGLLGAVTFMFGGWLVSKEQFPNMVQASAYLPWALWAVEGFFRDTAYPNEGVPALTLGLVIGLQLLAAHAQMSLLTLYLGAAWGLFRLFSSPQRPDFRRLAGRLVLAGVVAFGLAAAQVLPDLQMYHDGWRQNLSFKIVNRFYLPLNQVANWVLPTLHGHPFWGDFTARGNFWETCCYVGWVPFALAVAGMVISLRRGGDFAGRFWAAAFAVAFLMALGGGASSRPGLYWLAYKILPGFHAFHDPARCLSWASFSLAVLAALGLERLRWPRRRPVLLALAVLLAFADLAHFGRTLYPLAAPATLFPVTRTIAALRADPAIAAHQARFLAPDSARVWERFSTHQSYRQDAPDYQALWADTLTPNLPMTYGLSDAYGYEPITRKDAQTVLGKVNADFAPTASAKDRMEAAADAGQLGVRFLVTDRVRPPGAALLGLIPLFSDPSLPPLKPSAEPGRVFLSRNAFWQPRARLAALSHSRNSNTGTAAIVTDTPDQVAVLADNSAPADLHLADTLAPGWRATVDGRPVPLARYDGFLRSVRLAAPGRHQVVFTYRPETFLLGLYLTLLTLTGLLAVVTGRLRGRGL